jgi:hypothetical protein
MRRLRDSSSAGRRSVCILSFRPYRHHLGGIVVIQAASSCIVVIPANAGI